MGATTIIHGDSRTELPALAEASVDACVTDPPYALTSTTKRWANTARSESTMPKVPVYARATAGFMGQKWDNGDAAFDPAFWAEVFRVLKPGAHLVAFGGTRTYHRLACAIEDSGFEIRDQIGWAFGSGFPKSHDVAKGIDKAAGAKGTFGAAKTAAHQRYIDKGELRGGRGHDGWQRPWMDDPEAVANAGREYHGGTDAARQWAGWGTALKPAWESMVLAQKPHDLSQLCGIVARTIMEALCQLPSLAKAAAENSSLSRSVFAAEFGSAQWSAVAGCNTPADLFALTATWPCEWEIPSSLSIALSWLDILGASLSLGNTSTTETKSSLTTDLKTLKSLLSQNTASIIIEAATTPNGTGSSASLAARIFSAVAERLRITQELSALAPATSKGGTAGLRPNWEPIVLARKPLCGTVAANVLAHGTGALNIDGCRVETERDTERPQGKDISGGKWSGDGGRSELTTGGGSGRWLMADREYAKAESPIEQQMFAALRRERPWIVILCQVKIGQYRVDLLVGGVNLVVECDGAEFHSSPAQRAADRARDAMLRTVGYTVMRFTGRQIYRWPSECAATVMRQFNRST